jgi:outer membrane receptor protein involved in Fe transport
MDTGTTRMNRFIRHPIRATLALAIIASLPASPVMAQSAPAPATDARANFTIAAGDLAGALDQFSTQTGIQFVYAPGLTAGKQVQALSGQLTWQTALERLLRGSGLVYQEVGAKMVVIRKGPDDRAAPGTRPASAATSASAAETPPVANLQAVTVTGTRIRGGVTASPTITIDSQQIKQEGFTDLGKLIRSIPQNFSGGQNPGVANGATIGGLANQDVTGASALNLRGLGPDATLTLLNGRRLTYDGFVQAVDISAIPVEAVERVEIIPDGASAVYGSDAVAGVANVILRRDFDGVTLGARYGRTTSGGFGTHEYTATAGTTWSSGGLIATYKKASQDPIFADQRSYTQAMDDPTTIYGGNGSRSGLFSAYQQLGDVAKLQVDALRTDRDGAQFTADPAGYSLIDKDTSISQVSPNVEFSLPADWTLTVGGAYGKDESVYKAHYVKDSVSVLQADDCYCNKSYAYEVGAEGPLFALGANEARLAVGAGARTNEFLRSSFSGSSLGGRERSRFGYMEINLPVIDPASERMGMHRLEFSAAVRSEDYDSFGRVTTPKVGLIYGPSGDFTFKATWGKSFKAPTLFQRYSTKSAYLWSASQLGSTAYPADATVLMSYGGNESLNAERARTWTTSLAFHPEALTGLEAELTWFDIDYTERVVQPFNNPLQALSNPNYAQFIQYSPTLEQQAALLATYNGAFSNYSGADYDPSKVVALALDQYTNAARQRVKGADLSGSYRFGLGGGQMTLRGAATWLDSSQQNSRGQPAFDLAGTIFNPTKFRSRLGAVWARGGFTVSGFANYTGGVTSSLVLPSEKNASFTTFEATAGYHTGERGDVLSGMELVLSVDNLFNRTPPLYATPFSVYTPYDSTNYSAIGRYISLLVTKHW